MGQKYIGKLAYICCILVVSWPRAVLGIGPVTALCVTKNEFKVERPQIKLGIGPPSPGLISIQCSKKNLAFLACRTDRQK
jgi:hypothetical protein